MVGKFLGFDIVLYGILYELIGEPFQDPKSRLFMDMLRTTPLLFGNNLQRRGISLLLKDLILEVGMSWVDVFVFCADLMGLVSLPPNMSWLRKIWETWWKHGFFLAINFNKNRSFSYQRNMWQANPFPGRDPPKTWRAFKESFLVPTALAAGKARFQAFTLLESSQWIRSIHMTYPYWDASKKDSSFPFFAELKSPSRFFFWHFLFGFPDLSVWRFMGTLRVEFCQQMDGLFVPVDLWDNETSHYPVLLISIASRAIYQNHLQELIYETYT